MPSKEHAENVASNSIIWPALPQSAWSDTCTTLQLWMQIVGKVRLALMPAINHSWSVTLYPSVRGLSTSIMPYGTRTLQIDFDFRDHVLRLETSEGDSRTIPLQPMAVAVFYEKVMISVPRCASGLYRLRYPAPSHLSRTTSTRHTTRNPPSASGTFCCKRQGFSLSFGLALSGR